MYDNRDESGGPVNKRISEHEDRLVRASATLTGWLTALRQVRQ
jgi:hypothetical protein